MRRLLAASLLLLLPLIASAKDEFRDPTPDELKMATSPIAPGASAVILNWISKHDDEASFANDYYRIKILTQEGKKYGDIELSYVPGYSDLKNISARTIKPDGTIVPFNGKMYNKLVIKKGGFKIMNRTFSLPDVQPGSIVEYRYTRTWSMQLLNTNRWYLQREIPIVNVQLWVKPYGQVVSSFFTYKGLPAGKMPVKVGDHFELELTNVPPFDDEPYSPPEEELKPRVEFFYTMGRPTSTSTGMTGGRSTGIRSRTSSATAPESGRRRRRSSSAPTRPRPSSASCMRACSRSAISRTKKTRRSRKSAARNCATTGIPKMC